MNRFLRRRFLVAVASLAIAAAVLVLMARTGHHSSAYDQIKIGMPVDEAIAILNKQPKGPAPQHDYVEVQSKSSEPPEARYGFVFLYMCPTDHGVISLSSTGCKVTSKSLSRQPTVMERAIRACTTWIRQIIAQWR
jgi:hypothetical protein